VCILWGWRGIGVNVSYHIDNFHCLHQKGGSLDLFFEDFFAMDQRDSFALARRAWVTLEEKEALWVTMVREGVEGTKMRINSGVSNFVYSCSTGREKF